jgi:uncharacterized protein
MSPARAEFVNALELAGRGAVLERSYELEKLPRLQDAGALPATRASAQLRFALFERRPTIDARVSGGVALTCQRCLRPCDCTIDEQALLMVVASERDDVAGGYEPWIGDPEHLSVVAAIEEQILLALPLVPMHADSNDCRPAGRAEPRDDGREDRQRPFANLRELIDRRRS